MRFTTWLKKQRDRNEPVGDLANDMMRDKKWPKEAKKYEEFKSHLRNAQACREAMKTLQEAWEEFTGKPPPDKYVDAATQRRRMTPKLRFSILKRDGYRCGICGRDAKDGVKLHVDHIEAVAQEGMTEEDNLWVLCNECNSGKGTEEL